VIREGETRGNGHKLKHKKFHLNKKNFFTDRELEQAAQGGFEVSFSGDIETPLECSTVQPALSEPALAGVLD